MSTKLLTNKEDIEDHIRSALILLERVKDNDFLHQYLLENYDYVSIELSLQWVLDNLP